MGGFRILERGGGVWPLFVYRFDTNNAYYYQKFYSLQSYYSLWTQKRKLSEYAACENGDVENVKFML